MPCSRRTVAILTILAALASPGVQAAGGPASIATKDLKEWLTYIASDELKGRAVFTEGLGLAAGYIQGYLDKWGVRPAGDHGTYFQTVRVLGVKAVSRSSVTVQVGQETRTFKDGEGITFPRNAGAPRVLVIDRVEFSGYGLDAPAASQRDFRGRNVEGAAVVFLGLQGPKTIDAQRYRGVLNGRARYATSSLRAAATIGPPPASAPDAADARSAEVGGLPDFTTTRRLDQPIPPATSGTDVLFEFLFSRSPVSYETLRQRVADQDTLPSFRLEGVRLTFHIDVDYSIVRTQLTQNIVAVVEGSDTRRRASYVAFGAHYDHVGYAEKELGPDGQRPSPPGRVTASAVEDRVWNGADDDGSGTVALMALARAFAQGPRPKRSLLFVWHAGEERGLLGSRYFVDHPTVPLEGIVAQLNVDMIGRNRNDLASQSNSVYLVGSDRISTQLHQISRDANASLAVPLTLDYEMNDPADLEQLYYRSDHYSYAVKGIPIIFFTTGLHSDYHANTDDVSKIEFAKMARITRLVYETGRRVANLDSPPVRDNLGPRAGKEAPE